MRDCILEAVRETSPDREGKFQARSLSASTVTRYVENICESLEDGLSKEAKCLRFYSLALDESTNQSVTAQLLIILRGVTDDFESVDEEIEDSTTGKAVFQSASVTLERLGFAWNSFTFITTDGAQNMTGTKNGLVTFAVQEAEKAGSDSFFLLYCILY